jgi:hypothetical protein
LIFRWVKILDQKLLVYYKEKAQKANVIYDLDECEIKGSYIQEIPQDLLKIYKRNSNANFKLNPLCLETKSSIRKRRSSDHLTTLTTSTSDEESENSRKHSHLNYLIEIDHPYQQKCLIKGESVFETLEIYNKLKKLSME